ncbi:MAG: AsmA-like C-terminal region-containing protein, partial [Verrucomicrobiota bacterium]|nr:AsmA-like C-terminal region-containing protein [Verrucomicrobiota bacterium]
MLVIFHRPILLTTLHGLAVHFAAKQNLKLSFRAEGNLFTALTIRNLHVVPTGPAAVASADADYIRAEYNLWSLIRQRADFLDSVVVRNARVVIDPSKTQVKATPRAHEKVTLPAVFPKRVRLEDVTLVVRDPAHDLVVEHADLELNPRTPGELRVALLQLPTSEAWTHVTGTTTYENRNLMLRDVVLNRTTRFPLIQVDASQMNARKLDLRMSALLDGAPVEMEAQLQEKERSLFIKSHLAATRLTLASAKKIGVLSAVPAQGVVDQFNFDFVGLLSAPRLWAASGGGNAHDLRIDNVTFDQASVHLSVLNGVATLQPATLTRSGMTVAMKGTVQLPATTSDLLRSPAHFELAGDNLDLAPLTSAMPVPATGNASVSGTAEIRDNKLNANLHMSASSVIHGGFGVDAIEANVVASKNLEAQDTTAWFHQLTANATVTAKNLRAQSVAVDNVTLQIAQADDRITLTSAQVQRGDNQLQATGAARLPADGKKIETSTADFSVTMNAPRLEEFWASDSRDRVTGALTAFAALKWDGKFATGSFNVDGSGLALRDLSVPVLSAVGSIAQSKIFLNDLTANLNQRDYVRASGTLDLRGEKTFAGKVNVDIADLH